MRLIQRNPQEAQLRVGFLYYLEGVDTDGSTVSGKVARSLAAGSVGKYSSPR